MALFESKTKVDRLGDRLKQGDPSEEDLRHLDLYRRSFSDAYEFVISTIRTDLGLQPSGRAAKTTQAIVDKLRRETIRLSQLQDIAGCRLVVSGLNEQDRVVERLRSMFLDSRVSDRRANPSHGYRAVHVIVNVDRRAVEIQVRTLLQHSWAELCEKAADEVDRDIKYGGGPENLREGLLEVSEAVAQLDNAERQAEDWVTSVKNGNASLPSEDVATTLEVARTVRTLMQTFMADALAMLESRRI